MKLNNKFALIILVFLLSAVASIYGNGYSYNNLVSPKSGHGVFYNIQGDGWIESRSEMSFTGLAPWGNKISFVFNPWRPEGVDPAHLKVYLCGKQIGEFLVDEADKTVTLSLAAGCEPKIISFEVINPFVPSAEDQRELGAQVKFVKVHSKIGPPIVNLNKQLKVFLASILCALAFYLAFTPLLSSLTTIAAPAIILFLLSRSEAADFENLTALWILVTVFCFGIYLARILDKKGLLASGSKIENSSYSLIASIIVLIAGLIRFYGIKYGLPSNYHPDEVPKVNAIMRMYSQGSLDPDYFLHPSMLLYTSYGMNKFLHFFGLIEGDFRSTAFVAGRLVSAITGTLSVGLVYLIARRLFSNKVGLISAILLAVFPLHVACSRYMKEDAQLVFWILLTTWAVVKSVQDNKPWLYILSGLFAGISSSVKYSGFLSALIVAYGPWLKSGKLMPDWRWFKWGVIAALMFPVGFVLCTPYSILNSEKFIKDFSSEKHHMIRGHTSTIDSWSQYWMYHFSKSIIPGMGWIPTILGVLGLALLLFTRNSAGLYMFLLAVLFYLPAEYVKAKPAPQPERYILPCLPFLAIGAAYFIERLRAANHKTLATVLLIVAIGFPAYRSYQFSSEIVNDTRRQMEVWMLNNLPRGSKIYLDWRRYAPEFWNNEFEITYIQRAKIMPKLDIRSLKSSGQEYLVLSSLFYDRYFSQPKSDAAVRQRLREVFERVPIVKEINPEYGTYGFHNPVLTLFSLKKEDFENLEAELAEKKAGKIQETSNDKKTTFPWFVE